jgi:cytochrome P450
MTLLVSHPDHIQNVFQAKSFRNRPVGGSVLSPLYKRITETETSLGFTSRNGPDWEKHRSVGNKAILHPKVVSASAEHINNFADKKLVTPIKDSLKNSKKGIVDANAITSYFTLATILKVALNMEQDEKKLDEIAATISAVMKTPYPALYDPTSPLKAEFEKNADKLGAILKDIMKYKQAELAKNPDNVSDVLSTLLQMTSETDALSDLMDIVIGGTDTTATTLNAAFYLLGNHPEIQEKLYKEISTELDLSKPIPFEALEKAKYLKAVAKEVLRLYPAAPLNGRANEVPENVGGYEIPEGTLAVIPTVRVHHDARFYEKPHSFSPERWIDQKHHPFAWAPFGHGVRSCLGQRLALAETHIALAKLVKNFKWKYADSQPPTFEYSGITIAATKPVNVEIELRN